MKFPHQWSLKSTIFITIISQHSLQNNFYDDQVANSHEDEATQRHIHKNEGWKSNMSHKFRVILFPRGVIIFDVKTKSILFRPCLSFYIYMSQRSYLTRDLNDQIFVFLCILFYSEDRSHSHKRIISQKCTKEQEEKILITWSLYSNVHKYWLGLGTQKNTQDAGWLSVHSAEWIR